jgi:methionine-rich copper-binding protein CopC
VTGLKTKGTVIIVGGVLAFLMLPLGTARGHGISESSSPAADTRIGSVPHKVNLRLTEPPAQDSRLTVKDGCRRDVVTATSISGNDWIATVADAQPGTWRVSYVVVSAVDGHTTNGTYSFVVTGQKDCTEPKTPEPEPTPEPTVTSGGDAAAPTSGSDDGSSSRCFRSRSGRPR